jgi:hypothetical protein
LQSGASEGTERSPEPLVPPAGARHKAARERDEGMELEQATAEVLRVINGAAENLSVFE